MSGRAHKSQDERLNLARLVAAARDQRVPWKVLEHLYGRSRYQLLRYAQSHRMRQMQQQSLKCNILGASETG